jgi:ribosome-binding factor A
MKGERMRRVNEMLRETIADEVRELKDPRIGFVTITGVATAPDLRNATVYYSVLGDAEDAAATAQALRRAAPHVQEGMGTRVRLKYTPKLRFEVDPSIAAGAEMDRLLSQIQRPDDEPPASG